MSRQSVFVEIHPETGNIIRIIKTAREALQLPAELVKQYPRKEAVGEIRRQVVDRARRGVIIECEFCGEPINEFLGEMHEVIPKGKGGEVSLDNCVFICHNCHTGGKDSEHGDRRWQSSKK